MSLEDVDLIVENSKKVSIDDIQPYPFTKLTIISYIFLGLTISYGVLDYLNILSEALPGIKTFCLIVLGFLAIHIVKNERPSIDWMISGVSIFVLPFASIYFLVKEVITGSDSISIKMYMIFALVLILGALLFPWILALPLLKYIPEFIVSTFNYAFVDWRVIFIGVRLVLNLFFGLTILILGPFLLWTNGNHPRAKKHATIIIWTLILYYVVSISYFRLSLLS
nr:hypothetical protein [uncultured Methanobacterium sp.]